MKQTGLAFIVQDKKQLTALTSSARQEIVDVLSQMGTVSVGELAATLGRPADALYYHLRVLKQAGLVLRAGYRGQGVRKEELIRTVSSDLQLQYQPGKGGNGKQVTAIVGSMLRLGIRDFQHAFQRGDARVSGSGRELWALRKTGWLTPGEIVNLNRSIEGLAKAVSKPRGRKAGRLLQLPHSVTQIRQHLALVWSFDVAQANRLLRSFIVKSLTWGNNNQRQQPSVKTRPESPSVGECLASSVSQFPAE
jgi:DNA-binding transcriptional ArsR family regulator